MLAVLKLVSELRTCIASTFWRPVQEPTLRTACARAAFQLDDSNAVRISIDSDLSFTREAEAPRGPGGWWVHPVLEIETFLLLVKMSRGGC